MGKSNTARQKAIFGQSVCHPSDVVLSIISAYPGGQEIESNLSLAPFRDPPPASNKQGTQKYLQDLNFLNFGAGAFLRLALKAVFDSDPSVPSFIKPIEDYIFFTNAVKCSPMCGRETRPVGDKEINICRSWLTDELGMLSDKVPILIAGSQPKKSLFPEYGSLYDLRLSVHHWKYHPCTFTFNPIEAERGILKEIVEYNEVLGVKRATKLGYLKPAPLSVPWHFYKDLDYIKRLVIDYATTNNHS